MNTDHIRVYPCNPWLCFMVSCLCPFRLQVKQGDRPFVSVAVAVALAFVPPAVDVRVLAVAAVEPAAEAPATA